MITIDFEKRGKTGLSEYLYTNIKQQIINGTLQINEKLPSKRTLAEHLGISVITVQNAYSQLISEGYLYSIEKKGFFVTDIQFDKNDEQKQKSSNTNAIETNNNSKENISNSKYFTDFSNNSISAEKFPFSLWTKLFRKILKTTDDKLLQKNNSKGIYSLRKAISKYLMEFRNMKVSPEQIIIGAGSESLYMMIAQLLGKENFYGIENPGYKKIEKIFSLENINCIPISIDKDGINPIDLEKNSINIVHVSPSHHFPTGIVMPIKRRQQLLKWAAAKNNRYIIEDDYDSEFRFSGKPIPTLQSFDKNNKVIYVNTFSKTLSPSFRISYMVLPSQLLSLFETKLGFLSCSVSAFEQYTLEKFITENHFEKHIARMKNYYRNLRNTLIQAFENSRISNISEIHEEESGLHFLLSINSNKNCYQLKDEFLKQGINIPLLQDYYYECSDLKNENTSTFVINYSGIKKEQIAETIRRMEKVLVSS